MSFMVLQFGWTRGLMMLDKDYFRVFRCLYPFSDFSLFFYLFFPLSFWLIILASLPVLFYFLGHGINL